MKSDKNMSIEFKHGTCETCDYHVTPGHDIVCRRCTRRGNTLLHDEDHYKPTDWYCHITILEAENARLTKLLSTCSCPHGYNAATCFLCSEEKTR